MISCKIERELNTLVASENFCLKGIYKIIKVTYNEMILIINSCFMSTKYDRSSKK
jgi:hypothetical protein